MDEDMVDAQPNAGAGPSSEHTAAEASDAIVNHQRWRCVTHRPKQNKYQVRLYCNLRNCIDRTHVSLTALLLCQQSQVSVTKTTEKAMLPPHLARLATLTGGFYIHPTDAARASDK